MEYMIIKNSSKSLCHNHLSKKRAFSELEEDVITFEYKAFEKSRETGQKQMPPGFRIEGAKTNLALHREHVKWLNQRQCQLSDLVKEQKERTLNNHRMVREGFESDDLGREICLNDIVDQLGFVQETSSTN